MRANATCGILGRVAEMCVPHAAELTQRAPETHDTGLTVACRLN